MRAIWEAGLALTGHTLALTAGVVVRLPGALNRHYQNPNHAAAAATFLLLPEELR